jgi:FAD/FMN-containing dehydrogenase
MPAREIPSTVLEALKASVAPGGALDQPPDMAPYLSDFRRQYTGRTPLVLLPATTDEVSRILALCNQHAIGVVPHGGNTSYVGGATPDESASQIVLALRRLNRVRDLSPQDFAITVEAGCVLAEVQAAAEKADRLFPLSLGSEGSCQVGGNLSTNAGGTAVLRFGMMRDLVLGLEVVLADGRILDSLRSLRKDNSGYDLKQLFIGSEGTLGVITAATLKLFPRPVEYATAFVAVRDPAAAVELLAAIRSASGDAVTTFELVPRIAVDLTTRHIRGVTDPLPGQHAWYTLIELSSARRGDELQSVLEGALAEATTAGLVEDAAIASSLRQREAMWRLRETIPEAQRHEGASLKHDVSVPISSIAKFVDEAARWVAANVPDGSVIAYGHLGDGNLHFNIQQREGNAQQFLARAPTIRRAIHDLVASRRGSFSAEHGIGRSKIEELERYRGGVALELMHALKRTLDPKGILNPGKVLRH